MSLLDLFFPKRCVLCGKFGDYLCRNDAEKFTPGKAFCPVCLKAAVGGTTHSKCKTKYSPDGLICIYKYSTPTKELLHEIKYRLVKDAISIVKSELRKVKNLDSYDFTDFILLPIPLHKEKSNYRGFNQSESLGKLVAQRIKTTFNSKILLKDKQTKPQVELKKKERLKQMKWAFTVTNKVDIKNKNFIVFDDVWTTGATMKAAAMALKRRGAGKVWCIALASSH